MILRSGVRDLLPPFVVRLIRLILKVRGDPLVRRRVHGVELLMRESHNLPRYVEHHPFYDTVLPAFAQFLVREAGRRIVIVDIGANIGDTASLVAAAIGPSNGSFVCVEADDEFAPLLRENTKGLDVELHHVIAGAETGLRDAETKPRGGTSAVVVGPGTRRQMVRLDDLIGARSVDLIKTDTDGFEYEVLRGLENTLRTQCPYLFVELHPGVLLQYGGVEPMQVASLLQSHGYSHALAYDNVGFPIGYFDLSTEHFAHLVQYCVLKGSYVDLLVSKTAKMLGEFYRQDVQRYRK